MATLRTILRHARSVSDQAFSQRAFDHPQLGPGAIVEHDGSAIFVPDDAPAEIVANWVQG